MTTETVFHAVENIVVGALSRQDRFARNTEGVHMTPERASLLRSGHLPQEPDSRVVARDILNAVAEALNESPDAADYLRSQASEAQDK